MTRITLDHCVIHVSDWDKAKAFYVDVMGAEAVPFGNGYQFRWGEQQLNIHGPNQPGTPVAKLPVMPGGSDRPPMSSAVFALTWSSTLVRASLKAATSRSSMLAK